MGSKKKKRFKNGQKEFECFLLLLLAVACCCLLACCCYVSARLQRSCLEKARLLRQQGIGWR